MAIRWCGLIARLALADRNSCVGFLCDWSLDFRWYIQARDLFFLGCQDSGLMGRVGHLTLDDLGKMTMILIVSSL